MKINVVVVAGVVGVASVLGMVGLSGIFSRKNAATGSQSIPAPAAQPVQHPMAEPIGIFKSISDGAMNLIGEPRGIRNKNPLNMRWYSVNNWNGQIGKDESGFIIFDRVENGIRAAGKNLDSYARRGVTSMGAIIAEWAPASENNVEAYIKHVEQQTGWGRGRAINRANGDFTNLIAAMIRHENGKQPYSVELIRGALALP